MRVYMLSGAYQTGSIPIVDLYVEAFMMACVGAFLLLLLKDS